MIVFLVSEKTISVIGAGSIGCEVIKSLVQTGHKKIIATRKNQEKLKQLEKKYNIEVTNDNKYAVTNSDVVILSVKPKAIDNICDEIAIYAKEKLVISLAAKKSIYDLEKMLYDSRVCRIMTGIFVSTEIAAYTFGLNKTLEDEAVVRYIFNSIAKDVKEDALADRTWIACDTGLIAKAIEHKISCLKNLSKENARMMYAATLEGIAKELRQKLNGDDIYDLVAGPDSFTGKLHDFLKEQKVYDVLEKAIKMTVDACKK